ncbi:MAG: hypothetical protein AAF570_12435, partial [Bacteroidota bacterium]
LDIRGAGNRFKIIYQPIMAPESVNYWTPGEAPQQLAAYYEVSVVLLEPETSTMRSGRVLDYNVFTFVQGTPRLLNSSNTVSFTSPLDGASRNLVFQPAQVPPADAVLPVDLTPHTLTFKALGHNRDTILQLINSRWDEPQSVDATHWQMEVGTDEVTVVARENTENNPLSPQILPGMYAARLLQNSTRSNSAGNTWQIPLTSNHCPFTVVPRIDTLNVPPNLAATADVVGYIFSALDVDGNELIDVQVVVGQTALQLTTAAPGPGEFQITADDTFTYMLPADFSTGDVLPFRVFLNGAESAPVWITIP